MKLKLSEDPKEWRKNAWLTLGGVAFLSSVIRWRRHISTPTWETILAVVVMIAILAAIQPQLFRGFYRFSMKLGFKISQVAGFVALVFFFAFIITPAALVMRMMGKDPLRLRHPANTESYWSEARAKSSLDQMF
jgi:DMSO/TMAO reductase YedYZ heme-binding membrane subunit